MELPIKVKDMPNEEYHGSGYITKSKLSWLSKSPQYFKWYLEHPPKATESMKFGTAMHSFILEPDKFAEEYFVLPENFDGRKKEFKDMLSNISARGQQPLTNADYLRLVEIKRNLFQNKYVESLLQGDHEVSYFFEDEKTGIKCACRPDSFRKLKSGEGLIVDLKSTSDASPEAFQKSALKYFYTLQSALYIKGIEQVEKIPCRFVFIAIQTEAPYAYGIYEADKFFIEYGKDQMNEYLGILKECQESDNWYGYNGADGEINALGLPAYLQKELE